MRINYHAFERSDFERDGDRPRCAVCGNPETAATGTGHVDTQAEADRLNARQCWVNPPCRDGEPCEHYPPDHPLHVHADCCK